MKIKLSLALILSFLFLASASAWAASYDKRSNIQARRIEQAVKNGRLTEKEARRLQNQQDRIENLEEKIEDDGTVTKRERRALLHKENQADRAIFRKTHNARNDR